MISAGNDDADARRRLEGVARQIEAELSGNPFDARLLAAPRQRVLNGALVRLIHIEFFAGIGRGRSRVHPPMVEYLRNMMDRSRALADAQGEIISLSAFIFR